MYTPITCLSKKLANPKLGLILYGISKPEVVVFMTTLIYMEITPVVVYHTYPLSHLTYRVFYLVITIKSH